MVVDSEQNPSGHQGTGEVVVVENDVFVSRLCRFDKNGAGHAHDRHTLVCSSRISIFSPAPTDVGLGP